jgi:hypothetical protein
MISNKTILKTIFSKLYFRPLMAQLFIEPAVVVHLRAQMDFFLSFGNFFAASFPTKLQNITA